MFIAALFAITRTLKQPRCPLTDEWIKKLWYIYTRDISHKKEHIWVSSNEVDKPKAYNTEWSNSEREKQISYTNAYIWNLERWYWWTYLQGSSGDTDIREQTYGHGGGEQRGWDVRKSDMETYITICKTDSQWNFAMWLRELKPGL